MALCIALGGRVRVTAEPWRRMACRSGSRRRWRDGDGGDDGGGGLSEHNLPSPASRMRALPSSECGCFCVSVLCVLNQVP